MTNAPARVAAPIKSTRIVLGAVAGGLVIFGLILYLLFPAGGYPPIWVPVALGAFAVTSHLLSRTAGFNLKPVPAGTPPAEAMKMALTIFQASTILRMALSEAVAIVALVLSFVVLPSTWTTYLIGGVLTLILIGVNVWPRTAVVAKAQERLDRDGGSSFLSEALLGRAPDTTSSAVIYS